MSRAPFVTLRVTTLLNSSLFRALSRNPRAMLLGFGVLCFVAYGESSAAFAHTLLAALLVDLHGVPAIVLHGLYGRVALDAAGVRDGARHVEIDAVIARMLV